jgi:hypothetical protein
MHDAVDEQGRRADHLASGQAAVDVPLGYRSCLSPRTHQGYAGYPDLPMTGIDRNARDVDGRVGRRRVEG